MADSETLKDFPMYTFRFGSTCEISCYADCLDEAHACIAICFGEKFLRDHILTNNDVVLLINDFPYD